MENVVAGKFDYIQVGDKVLLKEKNVILTIVKAKFGNKYYSYEATAEDGRIWWMKRRSDRYDDPDNKRTLKYLGKVNQTTLKKKMKPHEEKVKQRSEGLSRAWDQRYQPGDMVIVNWNSGSEYAQIVSVDIRGGRVTILNSNWVIQSIGVELIKKKDKTKKPWKKVFELEEMLQAKKQKRQLRKQRRGLWW